MGREVGVKRAYRTELRLIKPQEIRGLRPTIDVVRDRSGVIPSKEWGQTRLAGAHLAFRSSVENNFDRKAAWVRYSDLVRKLKEIVYEVDMYHDGQTSRTSFASGI